MQSKIFVTKSPKEIEILLIPEHGNKGLRLEGVLLDRYFCRILLYKTPRMRTAYAVFFGERKVLGLEKTIFNVVSFSGGKDSTAMLLKMIEEKIDIDCVLFCDTGLEFPQMYEHIDKVEKRYRNTYHKGESGEAF